MRMRSVVVVVGGLGGLACGGVTEVACPAAPAPGESCLLDGLTCPIEGNEDGCGLNGYECRDGTWRELMTYCNPPPQELVPPEGEAETE